MKKMILYIYNTLFLSLLFFLIAVDNAQSMVKLNVPSTAGIGNAFVAEAVTDEPVGEITFIWRGKRCNASVMRDIAGNGIARILLPVPLNEKESTMELLANAGKGSSARAAIKVHAVKRPVQKLAVDKKFVSPPASVMDRIKQDREKTRQALRSNVSGRLWDLPLQRPVQGGISSQFGLKRVFNGELKGQHRGLDLRGATGTPIRACADGVVVLVDDLYYSGNTVYINHGEGVISAYLHMSATDVKPGEKVTRGQVIGKIGATGRVTGPHLHLSLFAQGEAVDPLPLLTPQEKAAPAGVNHK